MENMDKELTVPKWVLINRPKISWKTPQNLSTQIVFPSLKVNNLYKESAQIGFSGLVDSHPLGPSSPPPIRIFKTSAGSDTRNRKTRKLLKA